MKKTFLDLEVEVIKFGTEDIITTSGDPSEENGEECPEIVG